MKKLIILSLVFLSTSLFAIDINNFKKGDIFLTASSSYIETIADKGDNSRIASIMAHDGVPGYDQFMFLDSESSGLSVFMAYTDSMQAAFSVPIFKVMTKGQTIRQTFGPAKVAILYFLSLGGFDIIINPYLGIPFLQLMSRGPSYSGDQPFGVGLTMSAKNSINKLHYGAYFAFSQFFDNSAAYLSLSAFAGYEFNEEMMFKFSLYYDFNEFQHVNDYDTSSISVKAGIKMDISKLMDFSISGLFRKPFEDNSGVDLGVTAGLGVKF